MRSASDPTGDREEPAVSRKRCDTREFTYTEVGASRDLPFPSGYHHLDEQKVIGRGSAVFDSAVAQLFTWGMHRGADVKVGLNTPSATPDAAVELRWGIGPVGLTFCCRVIYVVDEPRVKGFAYGSLEGHPETGEERFVIEHRPDDTVVASISAFSRPGRWFTRLGGPANRVVQKVMTRRYLDALVSQKR
ncbi:DUF1990 family protein [Rhodococcus sp. MSC1_016]|uniref:DUF1990 family protein n=1 Tax=Rhodococcus sp. MSC1_016 TaxID=2909266 RepID=UPI0027E008F7|nr:DUF1990 domain-containing protein [Rhodococcus sp. MSC1_016]